MTDKEKKRITAEGKAKVEVIMKGPSKTKKYIIKRIDNNEGKIISSDTGIWNGYIISNFTTIKVNGVLIGYSPAKGTKPKGSAYQFSNNTIKSFRYLIPKKK